MLRRAMLSMFQKTYTHVNGVVLARDISVLDVKKALELSKQHMELVSNFYHDQLELGQKCAQSREFSKAIENFDQIIQVFETHFQEYLKPYLVEAYLQKSLVLSKMYDTEAIDQSMKCLSRVLELNPSHKLANERMDAILLDKGELPSNQLRPN